MMPSALASTYTHAHADWVRAEHTSESHHRLLATIDEKITAAQRGGNAGLGAVLTEHRAELARHTLAVAAAVADAAHQRDTTQEALMNIAGGPSGVVTEHDIQQRRSAAMRADAEQLRQARAEATDLDNQLMRAELAAARVFGTRPGVDYDLVADLPTLRREVDMLDEAGVRSPAAMYGTREADLDQLDRPAAAAVTDIAGSAQTVQPLHLGANADKSAVLGALATTALRNQHRILAIPASENAESYAAQHRYADTTANPDQAIERIDNGQWKLPTGTLLVVDDADQLNPRQLRALTKAAGDANAKLLLVTNSTDNQREASLTDMLNNQLPWSHRLADPAERPARTALDRVEHHLASTTAAGEAAQEANDLLTRRDELGRTYHDITHYRDRVIDTDRERSRGTDVGLDL